MNVSSDVHNTYLLLTDTLVAEEVWAESLVLRLKPMIALSVGPKPKRQKKKKTKKKVSNAQRL